MNTEPERRRRRPAVSCQRCRKNKTRCDRESPCNNCVRSRAATTCVYQSHPSQVSRELSVQGRTTESRVAQVPQNSISITTASNTSTEPIHSSHPSNSTNVSTPASQPCASDIESMKGRIRQLEEQLAQVTAIPVGTPALMSNSDIATSTSLIGGTFHIHHGDPPQGQPQKISRSVTHKSRTFGQSHWINASSLFLDIPEMIEKHREESGKIFSGIQKCKSLGKVIKSHRAPPWPCPTTTDLPAKNIADELIDCYLRTTETIYRILHVPSFRRDYEALWTTGSDPNMSFALQVKLVLAIGALTLDERFSMRISAIRWISEAQTWLSGPKFKSRLSIQHLQTEILLLLAREFVGTGGEPMWVSAGALLRKAVFMGLHRDPKSLPINSTYVAEMRRRLWNTILEINLQSGLTSGGPPFISLQDFDTEPPGNFDDDQLTAEAPVPKLEEQFTKVSIAIALRKTFAIRLDVTRFLNNLKSYGTYEETLRLDRELRKSFKMLSRTLQACNSSIGASPSRFEAQIVDFIMCRYLSALHIPFFGPSLQEAAYAYSRKVVIEASLKNWCAAYPASSAVAPRSHSGAASAEKDDLARLVVCGSGFSRTVAWQAATLIAVELRAQLKDDESIGPAFLRPDLLSVLDDAQIEALRQGVGKHEVPGVMIKAAEDAIEMCLPILEDMASWGAGGENHETASNSPFDGMEDWDFMMSDALFNPGNADPMSWMFNDETLQGASPM